MKKTYQIKDKKIKKKKKKINFNDLPKLFVGFDKDKKRKQIKEEFLIEAPTTVKGDTLAVNAFKAQNKLYVAELETIIGHKYVTKMIWWLKHCGFEFEKINDSYKMTKMGVLPEKKKGKTIEKPESIEKIVINPEHLKAAKDNLAKYNAAVKGTIEHLNSSGKKFISLKTMKSLYNIDNVLVNSVLKSLRDDHGYSIFHFDKDTVEVTKKVEKTDTNTNTNTKNTVIEKFLKSLNKNTFTTDEIKDLFFSSTLEDYLSKNNYSFITKINKTDYKSTYEIIESPNAHIPGTKDSNAPFDYSSHDFQKIMKQTFENHKNLLYPEVELPEFDTSKHNQIFENLITKFKEKNYLQKVQNKAKEIIPKNLKSVETKAISFYSGSGYKSINNDLYYKGKIEDENTKKIDNDLSNAIKNTKELDDDLYVFSGIKITDPREKMTEEGFFRIPAYMSTSLKISTAMGFTSGIPNTKTGSIAEHVLKIKIPKGKKAAYIKEYSKHPHEEEVLIHKNSVLQLKPPPALRKSQYSTVLFWEAELIDDGTNS